MTVAPVTGGDAFFVQREQMVRQIEDRGVRSPDTLRVMRATLRHLFLPPDLHSRAYEDRPLPIGYDATISQPYIVALMTELLEPAKSHRVLEIGTGSGYQAAVLAELGAEVVTIERIPELAEQARAGLAAAGYDVEVRVGDGTLGVPELAPFDAIAVAAAAPAFPETLYDQLRPRGRLVVPVGGQRAQRLELIVRSPEGPAVVHSVRCRFVPLLGEEGFRS